MHIVGWGNLTALIGYRLAGTTQERYLDIIIKSYQKYVARRGFCTRSSDLQDSLWSEEWLFNCINKYKYSLTTHRDLVIFLTQPNMTMKLFYFFDWQNLQRKEDTKDLGKSELVNADR